MADRILLDRIEEIVATIPEEAVGTGVVSGEAVRAGAPMLYVVPFVTAELVCAGAAADHIGAPSSKEIIVAVSAGEIDRPPVGTGDYHTSIERQPRPESPGSAEDVLTPD